MTHNFSRILFSKINVTLALLTLAMVMALPPDQTYAAGGKQKALVASAEVQENRKPAEILNSLGLFRLDLGADIFSRPVPDFNVLDPKYADVQLAKNIELVKKAMKDQGDAADIALETMSRFVRAQTYSFTDPEYGVTSMTSLLKNLDEKGSENSPYLLLGRIAFAILENAGTDSNRAVIEKSAATLAASQNPFNQLLRALVETYYLHSTKAEDTFIQLLKEKSNDPHFHYALGSCFMALEELKDFRHLMMHAPRAFEIALILTSNDEHLLNRVTNKFVDLLEKYDKEKVEAPLWLTEYTYKKLIQLDPENPVSRNNLGYFYANLNIKLEEALEHCSKAVALDPENPYFLDSLGWVLFRLQRYDQALEKFTKACSLNSQVPEIHGHLANLHYVTGHLDKAVAELKALVALDPDNPTARNNLGFLLADLGIDPHAALEHCSRAVALSPEDPTFLDSLGWVQFKLGNYQDAKANLSKALSIKPAMAEAMIHLANVQIALGETSRALQALERALEINPAASGLTDALGLAYALDRMEKEAAQASTATEGRKTFARKTGLMALLCENKGFIPRALEHYRRLLALSPDNETLKEKIAQLSGGVNVVLPRTQPDNRTIGSNRPVPAIDPDLKILPAGTLEFFKIDSQSISELLAMARKNHPVLASMNLDPLLPLAGRDVIQLIHQEEQGLVVSTISFFDNDQREKVLNAVRTLSTLLSLFRNITLEEKVIKETGLNFWTVRDSARFIGIFLGNKRLVISTSARVGQAFAMNREESLGDKSLVSNPEFTRLWAANKGTDPMATLFISGDLLDSLTARYPVLSLIKDLDQFRKIRGVLERIKITDQGQTLLEDYSFLPSSPEAAQDIIDYMKSLAAMAQPIYKTEGMDITLEADRDENGVQIHLEVNNFQKMKQMIKKLLKNNRHLLKGFMKGVSPLPRER